MITLSRVTWLGEIRVETN